MFLSKCQPMKNSVGSIAARICLVSLLLVLSSLAQAQVVQITINGDGFVNINSEIQCSSFDSPCNYFGSPNENVTLNAFSSEATSFLGWGGSCSSFGVTDTCTVTLGESTNVALLVSASFGVDTDGDLVPDGSDLCPNTPTGESVDANGCSASQLDADGDGVSDVLDQCPNTPTGEAVDANGCSASQLDADGDGVANSVDQCPATPPGETVDSAGCSDSQLDDDQDGVSNSADQCPATPLGETVDSNGCGASQLDGDSDGVNDRDDLCPNTPTGEPVDANGCSGSQTDADDDGVSDDIDQCPDTPIGEAADADGCSASQLDSDDDGVNDALDRCPDTPPGAEVDANGCALSQLDSDGDGVSDDLDQCPNTASGSSVDGDGCADDQLDSDGDGITDDLDSCPNTNPELPVDDDGCSVVQNFGNDLGDLPGLGTNEQALGSRIDEICPQLVAADITGELTRGQRDLRDACVRLKNRGTTQSQASAALGDITLTELAAQRYHAIELATAQHRNLNRRQSQVNSGGGSGVSVAGLNIQAAGQQVPSHVLESAVESLLGIGASEDSFADFGNLGIYLQGDIDFGDRDDSELESGYDFDAWNLSLGADYRFRDNLYAGMSIGIGEVEVDYDRRAGASDISNWTLSFYGGWQITDRWFLDGLLSYGESDYDMTRRIAYTDVGGSFESTHEGNTEGDELYIGFNTGYMFNSGGWRFGPTLSVAYLDATIDGYRERAVGNSSQAWNFDVNQRDFESLRVNLGGQLDYAFSTNFGVLIPGFRIAAVYEDESDAAQIGLRLVNNPFAESDLQSDQIVVTTNTADDFFVETSVSLAAQFVMGISGYMSYQFYSAYEDYSQEGFTFGLRWDKSF